MGARSRRATWRRSRWRSQAGTNRPTPNARTVDFDRGVTRHLSFGGGPHRCLGSHLARQELAVVLEEWHKRIPEYEVSGQPIEHGGQVFGVDSLNLTWG